jgi:hypothetical protein
MAKSSGYAVAVKTQAPELRDLLDSETLQDNLAGVSRVIKGLSPRERVSVRRRLVALWGDVAQEHRQQSGRRRSV